MDNNFLTSLLVRAVMPLLIVVVLGAAKRQEA